MAWNRTKNLAGIETVHDSFLIMKKSCMIDYDSTREKWVFEARKLR